MRHYLFLAVLLAACQANAPYELSDSGTASIEQTPDAAGVKNAAANATNLPDWVPPHFRINPRSVFAPESRDGVIAFSIRQGQCTRHSDRTGPGDCARRTTRSTIQTGKVWEQQVEWQLGQQFLYSFEFRIDPSLRYRGRVRGEDSQLVLARWENAEGGQPLFDLKLDARHGVTFMGRTCITPEQFGDWHRFNLRLRWADDDTGFIEARCDGSLHVGDPIFAASGLPTDRPLACSFNRNCPADKPRATRFNLQLGLIADPNLPPRRSGFVPLTQSGVQVQMRRILVRRLYVIFGRKDQF
ncbi:hypothetical protein [uncultured Aliiroseovarius sp.]|uniref:hypothetical protein n=1 Tax=uncultured Aliiroseovarius sp. TaxID=1658783 RepID=UPI002603CAAD|nr:hypothetical protein [uncultured Aliiroseovarius sp.]